MKRLSSILLRSLIALLCVVLISFGLLMSAFDYRSASISYHDQLVRRQAALEACANLLDETIYSLMNISLMVDSEPEFRHANVRRNHIIGQMEAIKKLEMLKKTNHNVLDLCLYYPAEGIVVTTGAIYSEASYASNYFSSGQHNGKQILDMFARTLSMDAGRRRLPHIVPLGIISRSDSSQKTNTLLMLSQQPRWSQKPFSALGILVSTDSFQEQLALAAADGCASIIGPDEVSLLSAGRVIPTELPGNSREQLVLRRASGRINLTYELRIEQSSLRNRGTVPTKFALLFASMAVTLVLLSLLFARWVNQPVQKVLVGIGLKRRLLTDESAAIWQHISHLQDNIAQASQSIDELHLRRLLSGQMLDTEAFTQCEALLQQDYAHVAVFVCKLGIQTEHLFPLTTIRYPHALVNIIQKGQRDMLLGVIASDSQAEELVKQLQQLQDDSLLKTAVAIAVGSPENGVQQLSLSAMQAESLMNDMMFHGRNGIELATTHEDNGSTYPAKDLYELARAVENNDGPALIQAGESLCVAIREGSMNAQTAALVVYSLTQYMPTLAKEAGAPAKQLCRALQSSIISLASDMVEQQEEGTDATALWASHVKENIAQLLENPNFGISLMARHHNMSDSAFSHMFKRTFNTNFIKYVNSEKIRRAKQLLADETLSIEAIAQMLGYSSSSNFSRMFRSQEQMTPSQYRQVGSKGDELAN